MDLIVRCERVPRQGETVHGEEFRTAPGGKGANQAVACSRLAAETVMVGRVGRDAFGGALREGLEAEGVNVGSIGVDADAATGVALILLEGGGDNRIVVMGGANLRMGGEDAAAARSLLTEADGVLMQLETPFAVVKEVAEAARETGVLSVLDGGAATTAAAGLVGLVDVVSPNEMEAEALTGIAVAGIEDAARAARRLCEMGARHAVVKLGGNGSLWVGEGGERHVPSFRIDPVDTTAAGDAFTACLAVDVAQGMAMGEAMVRANAAGALACLTLGAQPSMPTASALGRFLREQQA